MISLLLVLAIAIVVATAIYEHQEIFTSTSDVQATSDNNTSANLTAMECAIADQSRMNEQTRSDCLEKMSAAVGGE